MPYKYDYGTILTRPTIILSRLNDGEALSVKALAEEFNVSDRTIQNKNLYILPNKYKICYNHPSIQG